MIKCLYGSGLTFISSSVFCKCKLCSVCIPASYTMAIWATVQAFINWVLNYSDNHVIFKHFNPSILPTTTQSQMANSNVKRPEWEIKLLFKPTLRSWPWYIFILLCGRILYLPGEGEIFSLKILFRCGIFMSHLDQSFSSNCLQNVSYKNNL